MWQTSGLCYSIYKSLADNSHIALAALRSYLRANLLSAIALHFILASNELSAEPVVHHVTDTASSSSNAESTDA